ncbi:hypothetical protein [Virgibacillus pantothenticus]|uniref:hypothetical protein n=1 Tax=Virgibacillus pantothenticus TaxID=1473 RepID=UPI0009875EFB|nr:hypothetical protein [Virgibacillus pantothenticus]
MANQRRDDQIHRLIPYIFIAGVTSITAGGTIMLSATSLSALVAIWLQLRHLVDVLLIIGVVLMVISYVSGVIFKKNNELSEEVVDESSYLKRKQVGLMMRRLKYCIDKIPAWLNVLFVVLAAFLVIKYSIPWLLMISISLLIIIIYEFFTVMKYEKSTNDEEDELYPGNESSAKFFRRQGFGWLDYRKHPFSPSLLLFIAIIIYYYKINPFGVMHDYESVDIASRYVVSFPLLVQMLVLLIYYQAFVYISHNYNFLGFHKMRISNDKVRKLHFFELPMCWLTFLIWIFSIVQFVLF